MLTATGTIVPLHEARTPTKPPAPERSGYDVDVPLGGSTPTSPGGMYPDGRSAYLTELRACYISCPWLSAPIDTVARTVTAGGLLLTPDDEGTDSQTKPPNVQALQDLLDFVNPSTDIRQLLRGAVVDLEIFGDAFLEVVWLLGRPVALHILDPATMTVLADEHGTVSGYEQNIDIRSATFEPHEVIHIDADSPYGSLYGVGTAQKAMLPVTIWLFTAALLKETMRKGNPPHIHMDFPLEVQQSEVRKWRGQYATQNLGAANIGAPITSRGGANLTELQPGKIPDLLATLDQARDTILSEAGVPPSKVGVIESGNLGGGTGVSQDKTFRVNKCDPIAAIVLEKLNYHLTDQGFGIEGWSLSLGEVDTRDDEVVEKIRDQRLRNGSWTLDRYLADIGEPTVGPEGGGETHVLVDKTNIVLWADMPAMSAAMIAAKSKATADKAAVGPGPGDEEPPGDPDGPEPGDGEDEDGPPEEAAAVSWRRSVAEHYRRLVGAAHH